MKLEDIINKYLNQERLSDEEKAILDDWKYQRLANEKLLKRLESLKTDGDLARRLEREANGTFFSIWEKLKTRKSKTRRLFMYRVAAAAVLVLFAVSSVLLMTQDLGPDNFEGNIAPGTNRATLELADGSRVELSPSVSDVVEEKGAVINIDKGEVSYTQKDDIDSVVYNTIVIPRKGEYKIVLSDGSVIWLNAESKLRYPQKFIGKERRVFLEGEAYFEVAHDTAMPFVVETPEQELSVLGTKFNISAYPDENAVMSTLVSGSVKINVKNTDEQVLLIPGQQAIVDRETRELNVASVDVSEVMAWKEGFFSLENVTMEEFLHKLSRWYDVDFEFADEEAKQLSFKGSVPRYDDLIGILDILQVISPVEFKYQKDKIEVKMMK